MEGKIATQRARLVAKTGMNTLSFNSILWAFYVSLLLDCRCPGRESRVRRSWMLVEKFKLNL